MSVTSRIAAKGFTLLELAVVLVLVSLMAGFAVKIVPSKDCYAITRTQQRDIQAALESYVRANNKYPMPAGRALGSTNPLYGVAVTDANAKVTDGTIDRVSSGSNAVLVGALPFVTLNMSGNYGADCWGNKFTYYVSEELTGTTYQSNSSTGHITVRTGSTSLTTPGPSTMTATAAYAVISHGANALGASPRNFTASKKFCNTEQASGSVTRVDKENCDTNNADIYSTEFNNGASAPNFYDDLVVYKDKTGSTGCLAGTVTWGGCSAAVAALANGGTQAVSYNSGGTTGSGTALCTNGSLSVTSSTCSAAPKCASQGVSWGSGCTGTAAAMANTSDTTSVSNTAGGYTGTATFTCQSSGTSTYTSGSCTAYSNCSSSYSWGAGCSGTPGVAISHGASGAITNSAGGYTGSVTVTCNNGSYTSPTGATCTALAGCSAQTVNWSTNCSGPSGALSHGGSASVSNTASGYSGSVTVSCNNGSLSQSGATCTAASGPCSSQLVSWGSGCSATAGALSHGGTAPLTNSASGYTGSATANCSNGTTTASGGTCNANCNAGSVSWSTNCSASVGALNHGASTTASNAAVGYTGSATVTCTNGTLGTSSTSCVAKAPNCYEKNDFNCSVSGDSCGTYYYTDGSTELDAAPRDYPTMTTPPTNSYGSWVFCPSGGGGGCTEDSYICNSSSWCDACCNGQWWTVVNPWGTDHALTEGGGCALSGSCAAESVSWNTNCTGDVPVLGNSATSSVSNNASGYTGSATATCNNGTISLSSKTCTSNSNPGGCIGTEVYWSTCQGTVGSLAPGASTTVTNTTSGYTGSATATCNGGSGPAANGTISYSSQTCTANPLCSVGDCVYNDGGGDCCIANGTIFVPYTGSTPCGRYRCQNGSITVLNSNYGICPDHAEPICTEGGGM